MLDDAVLAWLEVVAYPAVELGIGQQPWTVLEWFDRLEGACIALDHDPRRVETACKAGLDAREGSFDIGFDVGLIRAVNVLRELKWPREPVQQMTSWLKPGGVLVEATTDKPGSVAAARLWGPNEEDRGWLFAADGQHGWHPRMFRGQVPRPAREVLERWESHPEHAEPVAIASGRAVWLGPEPG